jgi:hypothetical protein
MTRPIGAFCASATAAASVSAANATAMQREAEII